MLMYCESETAIQPMSVARYACVILLRTAHQITRQVGDLHSCDWASCVHYMAVKEQCAADECAANDLVARMFKRRRASCIRVAVPVTVAVAVAAPMATCKLSTLTGGAQAAEITMDAL